MLWENNSGIILEDCGSCPCGDCPDPFYEGSVTEIDEAEYDINTTPGPTGWTDPSGLWTINSTITTPPNINGDREAYRYAALPEFPLLMSVEMEYADTPAGAWYITLHNFYLQSVGTTRYFGDFTGVGGAGFINVTPNAGDVIKITMLETGPRTFAASNPKTWSTSVQAFFYINGNLEGTGQPVSTQFNCIVRHGVRAIHTPSKESINYLFTSNY